LQNVSDAVYKRLIAEAYPSPKRDIHAAVMAQVTAEAAQSGRKAKILTPAFRSRFVKFGSMAACFVLLVTLGFRVLPMMTKDAMLESAADSAAPEAVAAGMATVTAEEETIPETAASEDGDDNEKSVRMKNSSDNGGTEEGSGEEPAEAFVYSSVLTDSTAEEILEDDAAAEEAAPAAPEPLAEEAPMLMTAPVPTAEEAVTEAEIEECVVEEEVVEEAAAEECAVEEEVEECIAEEPAAEECIVEEAAPQTGTSSFESELKLALIREIDAEAYTAWLTGQGYTSADDWTVAEFVHDHAISRERFTELYDALTAFFEQTSPDAEIISYNLDELYRQ